MTHRFLFTALVTAPFLPLTVAAQQPQDSSAVDSTVFKIREITVTVARPLTAAGGASAVRANLDSMRARPSPMLEDVLRRIPFIQIRVNSRGEAQPTLRGMGSRRVAVLVDGVPLTLGWDDRADLSIIPLNAAREVVVVRGLSSVLHGPNALGGVVQVAIAEGPAAVLDPDPFQAAASVDHLGNAEAGLGLATVLRGEAGELMLRAGGGYRNREEFPRPQDVMPAVPGIGDARLNSDFQQGNGYLVARYQTYGGSWLSLSSFAFRAERGVPPEIHIQDPRTWRIPKAARWLTALSGGTGWRRTPLGEGDLEASVGLDFGETDIDNYASLAYDTISERELGDDRTLSLRLLGDHSLGSGVLRGAFTLAETRHVETLEPGGVSTFKQSLWSLGLETELPLLTRESGSPRARVSVGLSLDRAATPETGGREPRAPIWAWGARAGATLALGDGGTLLNGGVSRRVRFPALRELYSGALGRFVVNPNLNPEELVVAELGLTMTVGGLEGQAVGFHQRLTDGIVRTGLGNGQFQRQNRDEILSTGLELLANYSWRQALLAADVTFLNVELRDPTAPATQRRPEYKPWIAGSLSLYGPLVLGIYGAARVQHLGTQYCVNPDTATEDRLDPRTWLGLEVTRTFPLGRPGPGRTLEVGLALDNVTDSDVFDQCGLPQPGRLLRLGVRFF